MLEFFVLLIATCWTNTPQPLSHNHQITVGLKKLLQEA